ncbi:glycogen debranching protein [Aggregicoccus sp. 17bor-14]|nr:MULTISPECIES: amylo-alpha-1,6-glucosidase [Myxococcaceae]MBF5041104.1 glycogen debranching enzyme N-terminal domain-containing protein [Simulacricoccus sp. 17bor-14]MRI86891.1 glycogen debranching protein [Aggregicoccus sp. 17bor-14]
MEFQWPRGPEASEVLSREWLVTNGRGGYASGTIAGCNTRRYHGLFIPNIPEHGRTVLLARLTEEVVLGGGAKRVRLDAEEHADGTLVSSNLPFLRAFRLHGLLPEWEFEVDGARLRRRLVLVHGTNSLFVAWDLLSGSELTLRVRPYPVMRPHDQGMPPQPWSPVVNLREDRVEVRANEHSPAMRMKIFAPRPMPFVGLYDVSAPLLYRTEKARGYDHVETQASPGYFECTLRAGETVVLGVTTEDWSSLGTLPTEAFEHEQTRERHLLSRAPAATHDKVAERLVLAADQFVIEPMRPRDDAWARAIGHDARSVIAGYHWFTDWGRDTMISLEGLTLCTGRLREAAAILRTFRHYVRDGLLPNLFPEGNSEGLYHTADATLWFFHAIDRYLETTKDRALLQDFFPTLQEIVTRHLQGTRFNIRIDPADGLFTQGEQGYQLTWMDAKVDGWVVTPRRGKAVELNALWYNALRLMATWAEQLGEDPAPYVRDADRTEASFNQRFWNEREGCLYDVVDAEGGGNDAAVRPNQIFAISLRNPVLRRDRWEPVLRKVTEQLLTPVGLRSLAPGHPDYKPNYDGNLRARDAAYHQGTVWSWLIGHYVDARLKVDPDRSRAREVLSGLQEHLEHAGVGQVSEIFDATEPYRPRGCIAQAWGIAEALRVFLKTTPAQAPGR